MLYPQQRERENRFKLALRTAIPTFLLIIMLFVLFFRKEEFLLFFTVSMVSVLIMAYYNLHVIYSGFNENMMDLDTNVFNYKALKKIIQKELAKKQKYTLMMIKIGDLESINAHYGRELANNVLRETIKMLLQKVEEKGFKKVPVGYYGGGYFLAVFKADAVKVNASLSPLFKRVKSFYSDDIELEIDSAMIASNESSLEEQIKVLLELLNRPHFDDIAFDHELGHDEKLKAIELRIRDAIEDASLSLQYQNVKNSQTGMIDIVEFSAKLVDRDGKFIHHSDIMPVINRLGLEKVFYLLVLKKIMAYVFEKNISQKVCITISAFALRHKEIRSEIPLLLREYEIKPGQLILAVIEERYYKHIERYKEIIEHYRSNGVGIAFTNIGSNGWVIEYLKTIQVDYIKYDRYFSFAEINSLARTVYESLDTLMRQRGIKRWAIMVEDEECELTLKTQGIDYLQGWHIGKFLPIETINQ